MSLCNMVKVLVVGAGMTGASAAALLRQRLPTDSSITVWDKARGAGSIFVLIYTSNFSPSLSTAYTKTR